jgi:hypothetical protein
MYPIGENNEGRFDSSAPDEIQVPNLGTRNLKSMKYRASLCLWEIGLALLIFASQAHAQFEKKAWPKSFNAPLIEYTDLSGKIMEFKGADNSRAKLLF